MHPRNLARSLTLRPAHWLLAGLGALLCAALVAQPAFAGVGPADPVERQGPGALTVLLVAIVAIVVLIMLGGLLNIRGDRGRRTRPRDTDATRERDTSDTTRDPGPDDEQGQNEQDRSPNE